MALTVILAGIVKDDCIMKLRNNKIKVHRYLGEFFGRETTMFDLLAIITSSVSFAALTLILKWNIDINDSIINYDLVHSYPLSHKSDIKNKKNYKDFLHIANN
jgi:hypothetical protein